MQRVTTGVAPREYLDTVLAEPFEPFVFSPADAAVYQLGPFGTAAKKLKAMTTEEFERIVKDWIATARHPRFERLCVLKRAFLLSPLMLRPAADTLLGDDLRAVLASVDPSRYGAVARCVAP